MTFRRLRDGAPFHEVDALFRAPFLSIVIPLALCLACDRSVPVASEPIAVGPSTTSPETAHRAALDGEVEPSRRTEPFSRPVADDEEAGGASLTEIAAILADPGEPIPMRWRDGSDILATVRLEAVPGSGELHARAECLAEQKESESRTHFYRPESHCRADHLVIGVRGSIRTSDGRLDDQPLEGTASASGREGKIGWQAKAEFRQEAIRGTLNPVAVAAVDGGRISEDYRIVVWVYGRTGVASRVSIEAISEGGNHGSSLATSLARLAELEQ